MRIAVPVARPGAELYIGRHRLPDWPVPANPPARDLAELEGATRDLNSPAGLKSAARTVWGYGR